MARRLACAVVATLVVVPGVAVVPSPVGAQEQEATEDESPGVTAEPLLPLPTGDFRERSLSSGSAPKAWVPPASSRDSLSLGGAGVDKQAGDSPVSVSATDAADEGRLVEVEVFDQAVAERVRASGFVFRVAAEPGRAGDSGVAEKPLEVVIDFSGIVDRYGADFVGRLKVVALPECVLVDPLPKDCPVAGTPLPAELDRVAGVIRAQLTPGASLTEEPVDPATPDGSESPTSTTTTTTAPPTSTTTTTTPTEEPTTSTTAGEAPLEAQAVSSTAFFGGGGGTVMALTAGASSSSGTYTATTLAASSSWQVGVGSGEFNWSYPIPMQPAPSGTTPALALSYSSGSIDGMTGGDNNQSDPAGLGWGITQAFVERTFKTCNQDGYASEDLCWYSDNAVLHLNGLTSRMWKVDSAGTEWRLERDPNWKVKHLTYANNGDNDGEWWQVITPDGTVYTFGRNDTPEVGDPTPQSAWTVPVLHTTGEGECAHPFGDCKQAWRWNLERVEDLKGNVTSYYYDEETNWYGWNNGTQDRQYSNGGILKEIRWGILTGDPLTAHARLEVQRAFRCIGLHEPGDPQTCAVPTPSNGTDYPDVPNDLICEGSCIEQSPTFFDRQRIYRLSSQIRDGGWEEVDAVRLGHDWAYNNDGVAALWLRHLGRSGHSESGAESYPTIRFNSNNLLNNRIAYNLEPGGTLLSQYRLGEIYTDTGTRIKVTYDNAAKVDPCPATSQFPGEPGATFAWDENPYTCFPRWFSPEDPQDTRTGVFIKYLVTKVETFDETAVGSPRVAATSYDYNESAAWHYDANPVYPSGTLNVRNWSDWRGYGVTTTHSGDGGGTQTHTEHRVYRGMHGDFVPGGGNETNYVTTYGNVSYLDYNYLQGRPLEVRHTNATGNAFNATVYEYRAPGVVTACCYGGAGVWSEESRRIERRAVTPSGTQYRVTETVYDDSDSIKTFVPTQTSLDGWDSTATSDTPARCVVRSYVTPDTTSWKLAYPSTEVIREGGCAAPDVSNTRWYYDNQALGATPTQGLVTSEQHAKAYGQWLTPTVFEYNDPLDRITKVTDPNGNITTTSYTDTPYYPGSTEVRRYLDTNLAGSNYHSTRTWWHPERVTSPIQIRDPNSKYTNLIYDDAGRLLDVILPTEQATPSQPSMRFTYQLNEHSQGYGVQGPIKVTSQTLQTKSPQNYLTSHVLYDGSLRERQTHTQSPQGGTIFTDITYDSRGLRARTAAAQHDPAATNPGTAILTYPAGTPDNYHQFSYDDLERQISDDYYQGSGGPDWFTTTSYTHDTVTTYPPAGGDTRQVTDELDQVTKVETLDGTWTGAVYSRDALGLLQAITDAAGNTIEYDYDRVGRRTAMRDPDAGTWAYDYDDAGNQTRVVDNNPATPDLHTTYDRLNRPTSLREGSATSSLIRAEWTYDTLAKGQLTKSVRHQVPGGTTADYTVEVTGYDDRYQPTGRRWTIPASLGFGFTDYTVNYPQYDSAGNRTQVTYPAAGGLGAETVTTTYTDLGIPEKLQGSGGDNYVKTTTLDPLGRVTQRKLGGGTWSVTRTYGYDAHQRLNNWKAVVNGTTVQDDTVSFDQVGNVTERYDPIGDTPASPNPTRECFHYDDSLRLDEAWTTTGTCTSGTPNTGDNPYDHTYRYKPDGKIDYRNEGAGQINYHYEQTATFTPIPLDGDWDGNGTDTPGLYYPATGTVTGRNDLAPGPPQFAFVLDFAQTGDIPIAGDWDGTGGDTLGTYRPSDRKFRIRNSLTSGTPDTTSAAFGSTGDLPVVGDWDGNGTDTIGVRRPSTSTFYARNDLAGGSATLTATYGSSTDKPLAGDWDGDGDDTIGVHRPSTNTFYGRNTFTGGTSDVTAVFGSTGDTALAGNWDGTSGDGIGVHRPSNNTHYLRNAFTTGTSDATATLTAPQPHAVTDLSGPNDCNGTTTGTPDYCYDPNGNLTGRPGTTGTNQTLTWDVENRLTGVDDNGTPTGGETSFVYDPDGARLIRQTPTDTTLYVEGNEITKTGTTITTKRYYDIDGITVAVRDSITNVNWMLGDHLGSTSLTINRTTGATAIQRYLPYGTARSGTITATDRSWIGQTKDTSTGLQYLNARYYDPTIGRFTATDPLADLSTPGTLDAYGYAGGSPVTSKDPSGLLCEGDSPCGRNPKKGGAPTCIGACTGPPKSTGGGSGSANGTEGSSTPSNPIAEAVEIPTECYVSGGPFCQYLWGQYYATYDPYGYGRLAVDLGAEVTGAADMQRCLEHGDAASCAMFAMAVTPGGGLGDDAARQLARGLRALESADDAVKTGRLARGSSGLFGVGARSLQTRRSGGLVRSAGGPVEVFETFGGGSRAGAERFFERQVGRLPNAARAVDTAEVGGLRYTIRSSSSGAATVEVFDAGAATLEKIRFVG